jgi:rRNA maturation RNase YbeY
MIAIRNTQRKVKINIAAVKKDAQILLNALDYSDFDLGIWFASNATIRKYNKQYRNADKPTDILSFSYHPTLKAGTHIRVKSDEDKNLGDLIIAPEYVMNDLPKWETTFEKHLQRLLVHGICHLLGYDHIDDKDYKVMHKQEMGLLKKLQQ